MVNTSNNILSISSLHKQGKNYHIHMSELGFIEPKEDSKGRFYFKIDIDGKYVKFAQSGELPNIFLDETEAYVFTTINDNTELHIINDY